MRLVPMEGERFHLARRGGGRLCDENTIGVVAILGSTFDGSYEPVAEICAALDALQSATGLDIPVHVDGASGGDDRAVPRPGPGVGLPPAAGGVDQHLGPQVRTRLPGRRLGRSGATPTRCPRSWSSGSTTWAATCRPSRSTSPGPGAQVVAQYYNFLRLGFEATARCSSSPATSPRGWPTRSPSSGRSSCSPGATSCRCSPSQLEGRRRQLHGLRRLARAARTRLAGPGLHLPGEPRRTSPCCASSSQGLQPRPRRPARREDLEEASCPACKKQAEPVHGPSEAQSFHH